jgi:hypothetical protein
MARPSGLPRWAAAPSQEHQGPVGRVATTLQRFTGNASALVSGAPWWDTSGTLAQPGAAADAVDRRRFSKPSCPARLILFRWAAKAGCQ